MPMKKKRMAKRVNRPSTSGPTIEPPDEQEDGEGEAEGGDDDPQHADRTGWAEGESRHEVKVEAEEAEQAVFRHALFPLGVAHLDLDDRLGVGIGQRRDETGGFLAHVHRIDNAPGGMPGACSRSP